MIALRARTAVAATVPVCLIGAAVALGQPASADSTVVFAYTGAAQTWTVPNGVTAVEVTMVGAGGGGGRLTTAFGGGGGAVTGILTVVPGDTLTVIVGQGGINDNVPNQQNRNYRYGGGASGDGNSVGGTASSWGSGGGRTAVRSADALYGTDGDILTAGGGGGGGYSDTRGAGGAGGGSEGAAGGRGDATNAPGGGTQVAGGAAGGPQEAGVAGIQYAGGYAQLSGGLSEGGGGGGGYYGGGGAGDNGGGGGGSSYLGSSAYFAGSTTAGSGRTAGLTTWPSACGSDPGQGAAPGASSSVGEGGNGCVVIDYNPSSPADAPPPWLQAYGRPEAASECSQGWNPSWAEWPGDRAGGYTCERRLQYIGGTWVYLPGFPH